MPTTVGSCDSEDIELAVEYGPKRHSFRPTNATRFFFSSRRRHTRFQGDWSSDVCSSDLGYTAVLLVARGQRTRRLWVIEGTIDYGTGNRWRRYRLSSCVMARSHSRRTTSQIPSSPRGEIGRASCRERV